MNLHGALRFTLFAALVAITEVGMAYIASELAVLWYMDENSVTNRIDLSEDMGFGMFVVFWIFVALVIVLPFALIGSKKLVLKLLP